MRQRVVIAMALALDPKLIIADEPTTGLDVVVQDEIIGNILQIQEETDSSLLLITHDLSVIAETCDQMSVLYGGMVMEQGRIDNLLLNPSNPYIMGLKSSYPALDTGHEGDLVSVPGEPPNLDSKPTGCAFEPRCPFATDTCSETVPALEKLPYRHHRVACHHVEQSNRMRSEAEDSSTWGEAAEGSRTPDGEVLLEVEKLRRPTTHANASEASVSPPRRRRRYPRHPGSNHGTVRATIRESIGGGSKLNPPVVSQRTIHGDDT